MPHIELKLPAICKGRTIYFTTNHIWIRQLAAPDTDSLSPTTAKFIKLQRQLDAFLQTSLIFPPKYSFCLNEKQKKDVKREHREQFNQTKKHFFNRNKDFIHRYLYQRQKSIVHSPGTSGFRQQRLSTSRQRARGRRCQGIHMPDPTSGQTVHGPSFLPTRAGGPRATRHRSKLHAPDVTLAEAELARGTRLPRPESRRESRLFHSSSFTDGPFVSDRANTSSVPSRILSVFPCMFIPQIFPVYIRYKQAWLQKDSSSVLGL